MQTTTISQRDWTQVGEAEVSVAARGAFEAAISELDWQRFSPPMSLPMMQGEAIRAAIKTLKLPRVSALAWNGVYAERMAVLGIEANYRNGRARVYILDTGCECVPVVMDFWPSGD